MLDGWDACGQGILLLSRRESDDSLWLFPEKPPPKRLAKIERPRTEGCTKEGFWEQ